MFQRRFFTVGACVVAHSGSDVLLVSQWYRRDWTFPGGMLNRGERPEAGVERELREELGITFDKPPALRASFLQPDGRHITHVFCVEYPVDDRPRLRRRRREIAQARWFPADRLPPLQPEAAAMWKLVEPRTEGI